MRPKFSRANAKNRLKNSFRRRAAGSTVAKPNSTRAAGAGGSSNTMLKLYTDDSPGLRVSVFRQSSLDLHSLLTPFCHTVIHSSSSCCLSRSLHPSSSSTYPPKSSVHSQKLNLFHRRVTLFIAYAPLSQTPLRELIHIIPTYLVNGTYEP